MIAIVFWSARTARTTASDYRKALIEFHRALNEVRPAGFRYSATFQIETVPWFQPKCEIYEDWYVLKNFAGLDELDKVVVENDALSSHRFLMKNTAGACGAAMGLTKGAIQIHKTSEAYWMSKPRTVSVDMLLGKTKRETDGGDGSFWTRSMALGAYEHCLLTNQPIQLPEEYKAVHVHRQPVWHPKMLGVE